MSLHDFFAMGGYGTYLWMAYGVSAVMLIANVLHAKYAYKKQLKQLIEEHTA